MAQAQSTTPAFICDAGLIKKLADGVNTVNSREEAVFEFYDDRLRVATKCAANVQMIDQTVPEDSFESYDFPDGLRIGLSTGKLENLIKAASNDAVFEFAFDLEKRRFDVRFDDVEFELSGIDPESVNDRLEQMPDRSKNPYVIDVTLPTEVLKRATKLVDMATDHALFKMGGDSEVFVIQGAGDTDAVNVKAHEDPAFEWNSDPPTEVLTCLQSNDYLKEVPGLLDTDTIPFLTGRDLPFFIDTHRHDGAIETTIGQAPRISKK